MEPRERSFLLDFDGKRNLLTIVIVVSSLSEETPVKIRSRWFHVKRRILRAIGRWEDERVKVVERFDRDPYKRRIK